MAAGVGNGWGLVRLIWWSLGLWVSRRREKRRVLRQKIVAQLARRWNRISFGSDWPADGVVWALWLGATLSARSRFRHEIHGGGVFRNLARYFLRGYRRMGTAVISAVLAWRQVEDWVWRRDLNPVGHRKES